MTGFSLLLFRLWVLSSGPSATERKGQSAPVDSSRVEGEKRRSSRRKDSGEARRARTKGKSHSAMSTIFLMTRSQRSRIWSGDSPSGQPMVQMSQSSPISDRIVEVVLPARIPPPSDRAPRCVRSTQEEFHPSPRRRKERTFTDSIFPFPHILLHGATRFLVDVLEQQVVRLLGALPRRDKHVLDVRRVEDLALADDASPELADDRFAVGGQGDVGQSGLQCGASVSGHQGLAGQRTTKRDLHVGPRGTTRSRRVG